MEEFSLDRCESFVVDAWVTAPTEQPVLKGLEIVMVRSEVLCRRYPHFDLTLDPKLTFEDAPTHD
jgi:hypothetical protein